MADIEQAAAPRSGRMNKAGYKLGEKMELRLLLMEERSRSVVMSHQIQLFQDKLERLRPEYDPHRMQVMLRELRMKTSLPDDHLYSVAKLRTVVLQKLYPDMFISDTQAVSSKNRHTVSSKKRQTVSLKDRQTFNSKEKQAASSKIEQPASSDESQTATSKDKPLSSMARHYFKWLLRYFTFLQELHDHFAGRIYKCLCKYFYDGSLFRRDISRISRHGSASSMSRASIVSSPGVDSGRSTARSEALQSMDEEETAALQRERSLTSLLSLSQRFTDIGNLYDTQQVDIYAGRLKNVMDSLRHLLNEDDPIDSSFFSSDSLEVLEGLKADASTQDLIRLIPDVLVKLSKAAWLAKQWVLQDELRTKDAGERLRALLSLETQMESRLQELGRDVLRLEDDLSQRNQELQQLLRKEERSTELMLKLQDLQDFVTRLKQNAKALASLKKELQDRKKQLISPGADHLEMKEVQSRLKTVELQQFLVNRHLGTLSYQRQLTQADFNVELEVKPTIIHYTNNLQDSIERIEDELRDRHTEMDNIKAALMPVQEDRKYLSEQIHKHDLGMAKGTAADMDLRLKREQPAGFSYEEQKRPKSFPSEGDNSFWESPIPMAWRTPDIPTPSPKFRRVYNTSQNSSETNGDKITPYDILSYEEEIEPFDDDFFNDELPHLKGLTPDPPHIDVLSFSPESEFSYSPPPVPSNSFRDQSSHNLKDLPGDEKQENDKKKNEKEEKEKKEDEKEKRKEVKDKETEDKAIFSPREGGSLFAGADFFPRPMVTKAFPGRRDISSGGPQQMSAFQAAFSRLQSSESDDHSFLIGRMAPYMRNSGMFRTEDEPTTGVYSFMTTARAARASRIPRYNNLEMSRPPPHGPHDYSSSPRPDGYLCEPVLYPDAFYGGRKKDVPEMETSIASTLHERKLPTSKAAAINASGWGYRPRQSDVLETSSFHATRARALHASGQDFNPLNSIIHKPFKAKDTKKEEQTTTPIPTVEAHSGIPESGSSGPLVLNGSALVGPREAWQRQSQTKPIMHGPTPRIMLSAASPVPSTPCGRRISVGDPFKSIIVPGYQPEEEYYAVPPVDIPQHGPKNRRP